MSWWGFYSSFSSSLSSANFLNEGSGDSEEVEFNPLFQNKLSYGVVSVDNSCIAAAAAAADDDDALSCSGENMDDDASGVDHQGLKNDSSRRGGKKVVPEAASEKSYMSPENADDGHRIDRINSVDESCGCGAWDENMDDRLFWETCLEVHTQLESHIAIPLATGYTISPEKSDQDPSLNPIYADYLKARCPKHPDNTTTVEMDPISALSFDPHYYINLREKQGIFQSDAALLTNGVTRRIASKLVDEETFFKAFNESIQNMGSIGVLTGFEGQIRQKCNMVNI